MTTRANPMSPKMHKAMIDVRQEVDGLTADWHRDCKVLIPDYLSSIFFGDGTKPEQLADYAAKQIDAICFKHGVPVRGELGEVKTSTGKQPAKAGKCPAGKAA